MSFAIVTDTSANLPTPILKENDVSVIPFSYFVNGEERTCLDTESFNGKEYYDMMRNGVKMTTSQINPQRYVDSLRPILSEGKDVLFVGMSSGISGSFHSAEIAADQLRTEYPQRQIMLIDTMGASLGEGIPLLKAVECRRQGMSLGDTFDLLQGFCKSMYQVFIVDDLKHLKSTGRISGAAAFVGTVLQIKPLLKGDEKGRIVNFAKVRGRKKAIETLAEKYDSLVRNASSQLVGIAHADCLEDAEFLSMLLRRKHPPEDIMIVCYEPVTGSHVGPGTLALFFRGDVSVRSK